MHFIIGGLFFVVVLFVLNAVNANECVLDEVEPDCQAYCYSSVKPFLSYIPSMQKRLEACEMVNNKPPYDSERFDKIDNQLAEHLELMKSMQNQNVSCPNLQNVESKLQSMEIQFKENLQYQLQQEEEKVKICRASLRETDETLGKQKRLKEECQNGKNQLSQELESTKSLQSQLVERLSLENVESKLQNMENQLRQLVARSSLENVESKLQNMENQLRQMEGIVETCKASTKATEEILLQQRTLNEACQNERRKFKKIGLKYYHIENNEKLSWFNALQRCAEWGGHLVHLKSEEEWNLVTAKLQTGYRYWVDLNDLETENTFISATSGKKEEFVKWHSGEPSNLNKKEHCVELGRFDGFDMNDIKCCIKKNFICESSNERVFNYN